jgi:hypothetical protein
MLINDLGTFSANIAQPSTMNRTAGRDLFSFAEKLSTSVTPQSQAPIDGDSVTLDLHHMTGNQFMALEQTLHAEGKNNQTFLSPAENDTTATDQIAMYGSWAKTAAHYGNQDAAEGYLADQKTLLAQEDSNGHVTVDAATYQAALAVGTGVS